MSVFCSFLVVFHPCRSICTRVCPLSSLFVRLFLRLPSTFYLSRHLIHPSYSRLTSSEIAHVPAALSLPSRLYFLCLVDLRGATDIQPVENSLAKFFRIGIGNGTKEAEAENRSFRTEIRRWPRCVTQCLDQGRCYYISLLVNR